MLVPKLTSKEGNDPVRLEKLFELASVAEPLGLKFATVVTPLEVPWNTAGGADCPPTIFASNAGSNSWYVKPAIIIV
ncbi:hypothetical protein [Nostoc commune]|uniref:hypothetical protein n=1 Tax=Nostoc commune TaxID=1178 RepID=UPI0011B1DA90|nr:hypothetical protein [Nostoc commune]